MNNKIYSVSEPAPEWAQSVSLGNFALVLGKGSTKDVDTDNDSEAAQTYRVVAAAKTTKIEIKE